MFLKFIKDLEKKLQGPLPGEAAQVLMAPSVRGAGKLNTGRNSKSKKGSVLILLYPNNEQIFLPLMQRPDYDGAHGGQISFPGGKMETQDADLVETATREAEEEIGVTVDELRIIGQLSDLYIFASNFTVSPIVAYAEKKPQFTPNPYEVEKIIEAELAVLLDKKYVKSKEMIVRNGAKILSPYFDVQGHVVWGATAMMLSELLSIIKEMNIKS